MEEEHFKLTSHGDGSDDFYFVPDIIQDSQEEDKSTKEPEGEVSTTLNTPFQDQRLMTVKTQTIDFHGTKFCTKYIVDGEKVQPAISSYQNLYNHRLCDHQGQLQKSRRIITFGNKTPLNIIQVNTNTGKMKLIKKSHHSYYTKNLELDKRFIYLADHPMSALYILNLSLNRVSRITMDYVWTDFPYFKLKRNGVAFVRRIEPMEFVYQGPNNAYSVVRFKRKAVDENLLDYRNLKKLFNPEFIEFTNSLLSRADRVFFANHVLRLNISIPLKNLLVGDYKGEKQKKWKEEKQGDEGEDDEEDEDNLDDQSRKRREMTQICHTEGVVAHFKPVHPEKGLRIVIVEPDFQYSSFNLLKKHYIDFYHREAKMVSGAFGFTLDDFDSKRLCCYLFLKGWELVNVLDIHANQECFEWLTKKKLDEKRYLLDTLEVKLRSGTRCVEVIGRKLHLGLNFYFKQHVDFYQETRLEICKFVDLVLDLNRPPFVDEETDEFLVIRDNYTVIY